MQPGRQPVIAQRAASHPGHFVNGVLRSVPERGVCPLAVGVLFSKHSATSWIAAWQTCTSSHTAAEQLTQTSL